MREKVTALNRPLNRVKICLTSVPKYLLVTENVHVNLIRYGLTTSASITEIEISTQTTTIKYFR